MGGTKHSPHLRDQRRGRGRHATNDPFGASLSRVSRCSAHCQQAEDGGAATKRRRQCWNITPNVSVSVSLSLSLSLSLSFSLYSIVTPKASYLQSNSIVSNLNVTVFSLPPSTSFLTPLISIPAGPLPSTPPLPSPHPNTPSFSPLSRLPV